MSPRIIVITFLLMNGCASMLTQGMKADTMRAAIDECKQQQLNVLLYRRPDSSVFAIRCIPKDEEISKSVMVRPKMPMNIIRQFQNKEIMVIEDRE